MTNPQITEACEEEIKCMEKLLASKPLTITYKGGGIPDYQEQVLDQAVLVSRFMLESWKALLIELDRKARGF